MIPLSELVILACLTTSPTECERHVIPTPEPVMSCLMQLPLTAAKWAMTMPGWTVERVECRQHMDEA